MGNKKRNLPKATKRATSLPETGLFHILKQCIKRFWRIVEIVGVIAGIIGIIWYFQDKRQNAQVGVISSPASAEVRYLSIGSTRFRIDSLDGVFLKDGDLPVLSLSLKRGKLLVSTTIRDAKGEMVAELRDNEWQTNKNSIFDRNYTDNALEVREQNGKVALQVVHFGDTIHVAGIFRCRSGKTNVFCPVPGGGGYRSKTARTRVTVQN